MIKTVKWHCVLLEDKSNPLNLQKQNLLTLRPKAGPLTVNNSVCLWGRWWVGEWQKCSASCGSSGQMKRTVLCIQAVSVEEQKALQSSECQHMPKPEALSSCNTHIPCPADWTLGSWSKVRQVLEYAVELWSNHFYSMCHFSGVF